jgi:hypothetical protein
MESSPLFQQNPLEVLILNRLFDKKLWKIEKCLAQTIFIEGHFSRCLLQEYSGKWCTAVLKDVPIVTWQMWIHMMEHINILVKRFVEYMNKNYQWRWIVRGGISAWPAGASDINT